MNKVILMGRLTREPEIRYSSGEPSIPIARYTLAVDRRFKKEGDQSADFINCIAFRKQADFAQMHLHKGMKIVVVGSWQTGSYTNKDGNKVYTNDCIVNEHYFCEGRNEGDQPIRRDYPTPSSASSDGFMNIPDGIDEELPFS